MKIPFFYLDVGKIQVFQPQNTREHNIPYNRDISPREGIHILSCSMPEIADDKLFLNGTVPEERYQICINVDNSVTRLMTELIETLKQVEV